MERIVKKKIRYDVRQKTLIRNKTDFRFHSAFLFNKKARKKCAPPISNHIQISESTEEVLRRNAK